MKDTVAVDQIHVRLRNIIVKGKEVAIVRSVLETGALKRAEGNIEPHNKIQVEYLTQQSRSVTQPTAIIDRGAWLLSKLLKRPFQPSEPSERKIIFVLAADS